MTTRHVTVGNIAIGNDLPMVFIIGPNVLESRAHALEMSAALVEITKKLGISLIYKTSFDKANRTSIDSPRGIGLAEGLPILAEIRERRGCAVLTDIHVPEQCAPVAEIVDILQIPAFLFRQTDLLLAAGATGRVINIKKGQFLAPWDMKNVAAKIASTGNERIMLCERGVSFGYNTLVVDMRALPIMAQTGYPVVMDATHAVAAAKRAWATGRAASASSAPSSPAPRPQSASPRCLSRPIRTPTTPRAKGRPCCRSRPCRRCSKRWSRSTGWRRRGPCRSSDPAFVVRRKPGPIFQPLVRRISGYRLFPVRHKLWRIAKISS